MCGIAGFCSDQVIYDQEKEKWKTILQNMNQAQKRRGPDEDGWYLSSHCGMAHVRLSVIDLETGQQPMTRTRQGHTCTLVMNGEIYNMHELKKELENLGVEFETSSDTEVMLLGYLV